MKKGRNQTCQFGNLYLCIRAGFGVSDKQIGLSFLIQFKIPAQFETKISLALLNRWSGNSIKILYKHLFVLPIYQDWKYLKKHCLSFFISYIYICVSKIKMFHQFILQQWLLLITNCVRWPRAVPCLRNKMSYSLLKPTKTHALYEGVAL